MSLPCIRCEHFTMQPDGYCYMFKDAPEGNFCGQFKARRTPSRTLQLAQSFYDRNPTARKFEGRLVEMRSQQELLRGAFWVLKDVRAWRGRQLWTLVGAITAHGSGYSQQICEELGWDYDMRITPAARLPERTADSQSDASDVNAPHEFREMFGVPVRCSACGELKGHALHSQSEGCETDRDRHHEDH